MNVPNRLPRFFGTAIALLLVACDEAIVAEYHAIVGGVIDTFTLGAGSCP